MSDSFDIHGLFDRRPVVTEQQLKTAFLRQRQSLPLHLVIQLSVKRIRAWVEYWRERDVNVYVSLGGKDSRALLHLVRTIYPNIPAVFVDTGLEYPEVREQNRLIDNVIIVKPKKNFAQVVTEYGWPVISKKMAQYISETRTATGKNAATIHLRLTGERNCGICPDCDVAYVRSADNKWSECLKCGYKRAISELSRISKKWQYLMDAPFKISHKCCKIMKIEPLKRYAKEHNAVGIIGTTSDESAAREHNFIRHGCNAYNSSNPVSTPIIFWTEQHVLQYIRENNLNVATCYGEQIEVTPGVWQFNGVQRTGCMPCGFGAHLEARPNRFERMKTTHPNMYRYMMETLGGAEVLDYCKIPH